MDTGLSKHESWGAQKFQVLVSFMKPHKALTSFTVLRWFRNGLSMAGIDIRMFKSHSTYAASTAIADLSGVSVCDTVKQEQ